MWMKSSWSCGLAAPKTTPKTDATIAAAAAAFSDLHYLALGASALSVISFLWFAHRGEILMYGDAVAHISIARRIVDSQTPGLHGLGTVWLPLPHLLILPFIVSDAGWQSGVGGSLVSMAAFVWGTLGIFRLCAGRTFSWLRDAPAAEATPASSLLKSAPRRDLRIAGWVAAAVYAGNPNLLYLQATAMTESLSLGLAVWAMVYYGEFVAGLRDSAPRESSREGNLAGIRPAAASLRNCALALTAGMLTRYDHWALAMVIALAVGVQIYTQRHAATARAAWRRSFAKFILLCAIAPVGWLGYNFWNYGNAFEFANGPYSARAIAHRSSMEGNPPHPGEHNLRVSSLYFFQSAKLNLSPGRWPLLFLVCAVVGSAWLLISRCYALTFLLWLPFFFYSFSIAYGNVPIFLPGWWPFSYYNVRYGLELLPAFSVFAGVTAWLGWRISTRSMWKTLAAAGFIALLALGYAQNWRTIPITLREARANSSTRIPFEESVAAQLRRLPADSTLLMFTGDHPGALQRAGIHLRRVVMESNHPQWETALRHPSASAEYVLAMRGDPVWQAVEKNPQGLAPIAIVRTTGQSEAMLYRTKEGTSQ
jgi:hypothetical protein